MDKYITDNIKFKVMGENETNHILNNVVPIILEVFEGLEGQQILKSGYSVTYGELLKKYRDKTDLLLKEYSEKYTNKDKNVLMFLKVSEYSVILEIKIRFNKLKESGFIYYDNYKYLLNLKNGCLENICIFEELKPIKEHEQIKLVEDALNLIEKIKDIKSQLRPYNLNELIKL